MRLLHPSAEGLAMTTDITKQSQEPEFDKGGVYIVYRQCINISLCYTFTDVNTITVQELNWGIPVNKKMEG